MRLSDNGDGTVTDTCTGLMWQRETARGPYTWQQALQYCEGLNLAGHGDWRLPDVHELQSIVDYGRRRPSIDPTLDGTSSVYWSATEYVAADLYAWAVYLDDGAVHPLPRSTGGCARAVRGTRKGY